MKEVLLRENTAHVVPVMNLSNNKSKGKNQTLVILFQFANSNSYYIYNDVHVLMLKKHWEGMKHFLRYTIYQVHIP